jgi:hypothetical protein
MQPTPQRPEPPVVGTGSSKPAWTDPSLPLGPASQSAASFNFPASDPRTIERLRRRKRRQLMRVYLTLAAVILLIGAVAVWQLLERQRGAQQPAPPALPAERVRSSTADIEGKGALV